MARTPDGIVYRRHSGLHLRLVPGKGPEDVRPAGPYYKDPSRTAKAIRQDGWFHTGDLAAMDARGRFYIRGRLNNVILGATGENIYPEEIEFVINSYPGVGESFLEYVNKRVNKQSALARIEMLTEPFKKTATQKIRRFLYMTPSHA